MSGVTISKGSAYKRLGTALVVPTAAATIIGYYITHQPTEEEKHLTKIERAVIERYEAKDPTAMQKIIQESNLPPYIRIPLEAKRTSLLSEYYKQQQENERKKKENEVLGTLEQQVAASIEQGKMAEAQELFKSMLTKNPSIDYTGIKNMIANNNEQVLFRATYDAKKSEAEKIAACNIYLARHPTGENKQKVVEILIGANLSILQTHIVNYWSFPQAIEQLYDINRILDKHKDTNPSLAGTFDKNIDEQVAKYLANAPVGKVQDPGAPRPGHTVRIIKEWDTSRLSAEYESQRNQQVPIGSTGKVISEDSELFIVELNFTTPEWSAGLDKGYLVAGKPNAVHYPKEALEAITLPTAAQRQEFWKEFGRLKARIEQASTAEK